MNHEHECPFCFQRVQIILSTQMLVGTSNQLDYNKTIDKISQQEKLRFAQQVIMAQASTAVDSALVPAK